VPQMKNKEKLLDWGGRVNVLKSSKTDASWGNENKLGKLKRHERGNHFVDKKRDAFKRERTVNLRKEKSKVGKGKGKKKKPRNKEVLRMRESVLLWE